jgi:carbamoyl-phosphate synthase small subunit
MLKSKILFKLFSGYFYGDFNKKIIYPLPESSKTECFLTLNDGREYRGFSFGAEHSSAGEVVFNTAMTGYPESLTDPSYKGQILVLTFPLIGNYGVPDMEWENGILKSFESENVHISGLIIADYSFQYSHWQAVASLSDWLKRHDVPGIYGIDTRALTKHLREQGTMLGKIIKDDKDIDFYDPNKENLVAQVSVSAKKIYGNGNIKVILVDCGVKNNILRCLLDMGVTIIRVPWDHDFTKEEYDGIVVSNGPGDPEYCTAVIGHLKKVLKEDKPVFGICLGNQLMALAGGAKTYKLKYGHRGYNQPVLNAGTSRAYITSQNHGFAIQNDSLPDEWQPFFINLNDGTNEGLKHRRKPFFSSQFHPEASGGPNDTRFLFDHFMKLIHERR